MYRNFLWHHHPQERGGLGRLKLRRDKGFSILQERSVYSTKQIRNHQFSRVEDGRESERIDLRGFLEKRREEGLYKYG